MSENEATVEDQGGDTWDAPNQQVVRADESPPWEEGTGGTIPPDESGGPIEPGNPLDAMTKAELLEYAKQLGVSPANNDMTKEELRAGVDAKLAEGG